MRLRRPRLPAEARDQIRLDQGERILAWAPTAEGGWVVASDRALRRVGRTVQALGWERVDSARWDRDSDTLTVTAAVPVAAAPQVWHLRLPRHASVIDVIRERVTATVVTSRRFPVQGNRAVRVVGRRPPTESGSALKWSVSLDSGIDVTDPQVKARIDDAVRTARADVGE